MRAPPPLYYPIRQRPPAPLPTRPPCRAQALSTKPDDVLLVAYPKCGTSWTHRIVYGLLRMDHNGAFGAAAEPSSSVGGSGQVYPDGVVLRRADVTYEAAQSQGMFGRWAYQDLEEQPSPRLFTSHIRAGNLPESLSAGTGRLVLVVRNPKDALVSWKYFLEKLKMGEKSWEQHFADYVATDVRTDHEYGDYFSHLNDMGKSLLQKRPILSRATARQCTHAHAHGVIWRGGDWSSPVRLR